MKTERDSRFELLRILACVMIVFNHYASHGVLLINQDNEYLLWKQGSFLNRLFVMLLTPGGRVGVAVFFMLTGYHLINSDKTRKMLGIIIHTYYYAVICSIIALLCFFCGNPGNYSTYGICMSLLKYLIVPITSSGWWFVTVYLLLLLLMPQINAFIRRISKRQFLFLLLYVCIFAYGIGGMIGTPFNLLFRGCFFYLLGGYISKHYVSNKQSFQVIRVLGFVVSWTSCALVSFVTASNPSALHINKKVLAVFFSLTENLLCIPICAVLLFTIALNAKIKRNHTINKIAGYSFGIYLFHDSGLTRNIIWNIAKVEKQYHSDLCVLWAGLTCLVIIAIASLFELGYKTIHIRRKTNQCASADKLKE